MLPLTMISCSRHIVYKTKTEYIVPPEALLDECKAVPVETGATNKNELLYLVTNAYVDTLENINSCNIKIRAANDYIVKIKSLKQKE